MNTVITGLGALSSLGCGSEMNFKNLINGKTNKTEREYLIKDNTRIKYSVNSIKDNDLNEILTNKQLNFLKEENLYDDLDFRYLVSVIQQSIIDSNINYKNKKVSLVIGHENPGVVKLVDKLTSANKTDIINEVNFENYKEEFFKVQSFPYLFYLKSIFNISGPCYVINNACASGLYALDLGRKLIYSGDSDIAIIASSDYSHFSEYMWFRENNFLSKQNNIKPFDTNRDGTALGDGAAAIVIEKEEETAKRNHIPYCKYSKGFFIEDNWNITLPDVTSHKYSKTIEQARVYLNNNVDLLIPHGTGSTLWDAYEAKEIIKVFNDNLPMVTTFKGMIGHTLGASSLLETVLGIKSLQKELIPKSYNTENPVNRLNLLQENKSVRIKNFVKSVPAFGGFNTSCVFEIV